MINTNLLSPGTLLRNGTYRVERQLSSGGYGNTYVVTNVSFGETFAMKEFYIKGINERDSASKEISVSNKENEYQFETMKSKFCKEAVRIRKLDNPHIVKVYDMFDENGTSYYIMDYIDGESLSSLLKRTGKPVTEEQLFGYLRQILSALSAIHNKGIWHLDLKPGNIMIDKRGNVYLIDFGASKQFHDSEGKSVSTSTGLCYTPGYAPLEQTNQDFKKFGPWTDIYALGATMYNLLTAQKPLMATDILIEGFSLPVEVSSRTRDLISWMMRPRYLDRPQSVEDIRSYLEQGQLSSVADQSETDTEAAEEEETQCAKTKVDKEQDRTLYKNDSEETVLRNKRDTVVNNEELNANSRRSGILGKLPVDISVPTNVTDKLNELKGFVAENIDLQQSVGAVVSSLKQHIPVRGKGNATSEDDGTELLNEDNETLQANKVDLEEYLQKSSQEQDADIAGESDLSEDESVGSTPTRKWIYWVLILLLLGNAYLIYIGRVYLDLGWSYNDYVNDMMSSFYGICNADLYASIVFSLLFLILICMGIKKNDFIHS